MAKKETWTIIVVLLALVALFFHKTLVQGLVPFPGDALVSDFQPWRSASYLGYGAGGIPNKAQYPDTIRQLYPWKTLVAAALKKGTLPLWNPYNFSGAPLLANFQSAALYPLTLLYLLLPQIDSWTILVIVQPLLATLFTYLYSRKMGVGKPGSWLAAISYGWSGFMAVWLEYNTVGHVILWLPFMLLSIEHLRDKISARWLCLLALSHTMAILAGHPQIYAYTAIFSIAYIFLRVSKNFRPATLAVTAFGIGMAGIQIIPGIELITHAARSPHDVDTLLNKILIQPWQLVSLVFPNFFGNPATRTYWLTDTFIGKVTTIGLVPLFFIPSALRRKDPVAKLFIGSTLIWICIVTNNPISQILYRLPIPLISSSSPTLAAFLFSFSLAMVAGLGLDYWTGDAHTHKKLLRRTIELTLGFCGLLFLIRLRYIPLLSSHATVITRAVLYGALVSGATIGLFWIAVRFPKFRSQSIMLLLLIHIFDLFMFFNRFNPFAPKALVFPQHPVLEYLKDKAPDRYWGYGTANIEANAASQYGIFSPEGYDPLYPIWYGQFLYAYRRGLFNSFDNATRSDAAIGSYFGDGGLTDQNKQNILNMLSVRYILDRVENGSSEQIFPPAIYHKVSEINDWNVYENIHATKRVYFAQHVYEAKDARAFNDILLDQTFNSSTSAILTSPLKTPMTHPAPGVATITSYQPEKVTIMTESTAAGLLVLTDTYFPGWWAWVDAKPTKLYPANWALRAVEVPEGRHIVTMKYEPDSLLYGAILSFVSALSTITLMFQTMKHKGSRK